MLSIKLVGALCMSLATEWPDHAREVAPLSLEEHAQRGVAALFNEGKTTAAIAHFKAARRLVEGKNDHESQRTHALILNLLGSAQQNVGRFEASEVSFQLSMRLYGELSGKKMDLSQSTAATNLAALFQELGRFKEAERLYADVWVYMSEDTNSSHAGRALKPLGELYLAANRDEEAALCCRRSMEQMGQHGSNFLAFGQQNVCLTKAYLKLGKIDHAKKALDEAKSGNVPLHSTRGRYYLRTGEPKKAVEALKAALDIELQPGNTHAARLAMIHLELGEALVRAGEKDEGRKVLDRASHIYERSYGPDYYLLAASLERYCELFPSDAGDRAARAKAIREANKVYQPLGLKAALGKLP